MGAGLSFIGNDFIIGTWYRVGVDELLRYFSVLKVSPGYCLFSVIVLSALWYQTDFEIFKFLNKIIGTLSFEGL